MKVLTIAAACLFFNTLSSGECVVVETGRGEMPAFQRSSRRVRITTVHYGKARGDVQLIFFPTRKNQSTLSLSTDERGVALVPALAPGHYRVEAIGPEKEVAQLYLDVSNRAGKQTSSFLMAVPPTFPQEQASDVDGASIREHVRQFKGRVEDPTGAAVPASSEVDCSVVIGGTSP